MVHSVQPKHPPPPWPKPPLTKTPLQENVLGYNHVVITKNWQGIVIVKTKWHCPPNLTKTWCKIVLKLGWYLLIKEGKGVDKMFFFVWGGFWPEGDFWRRGEGGGVAGGGFCPEVFFPIPIDNNGGYTKY